MNKNGTVVDLAKVFISVNESDSNGESANVVDGLFAIARALNGVARALERLGLADAGTPMGAIEFLGSELKTGFESIAVALEAKAE